MQNNRIKKVFTKKGKMMYYRGNGLWFGRCGKDEAELGLSTGKYTLWETVNHYENKSAVVH
jgi:hypothetical protein